MDAALAIFFALAGFGDMAVNHCPKTGCLAFSEAQGQSGVQFGGVIFDGDRLGPELYFQRELPAKYGSLQPVLGLSITSRGDTWVGAGAKWEHPLTQETYVESSLMPGLYAQVDGAGLNHAVEFRSSLGVGWEFDNGARFSLHFDHRSNAGLSNDNPGLETLGLRVAVPL